MPRALSAMGDGQEEQVMMFCWALCLEQPLSSFLFDGDFDDR